MNKQIDVQENRMRFCDIPVYDIEGGIDNE